MSPDEPENKPDEPAPETPAPEPELSAEPQNEEPPPFLRPPAEPEAEPPVEIAPEPDAPSIEPIEALERPPEPSELPRPKPEPGPLMMPVEPPNEEPPSFLRKPEAEASPEPPLPPEPEPEPYIEPEPVIAREPEPPPRYEPEPPPQRAMFDTPAGEPDIPMPAPRRSGDGRRAKDARINLDLDLNRIKRKKRYGLFMTLFSVVFIAFVLVPVTWVGLYGFFNAPSTVLMMQRAGEGQTIRHYPVPINRISPHVIRAVIAAEDSNFCTHSGFDVEAIQDAMQSNARGRSVRGASTISQQTAKNLFLWPERSWVRKGFETYFTALIEFMWPKRRVMEHYLNVAEWGDGNFGIEAAARARFGVSAADLTPLQAARLAAVLPNPNEWRADRPGPYVRQRSATLVARARDVRAGGTAGCVLHLDRQSQS